MRRRAGKHLAVVATPAAWRSDNSSSYRPFLKNRSDHDVLPEKELIGDGSIAPVRKLVFQRSHDRLAGAGSAARKAENLRPHLLVQKRGLAGDFQVLRIQDSPRRRGELHHRHQRMELSGSNDEFFVERFGVAEGHKLTAADQVGARE